LASEEEEEEEEEEEVSDASRSAPLQELETSFRDAETITGNIACVHYNHKVTQLPGICRVESA